MYFQPSSDHNWSLPVTSSPRFSGSIAAALGVRLREAFPIDQGEDDFADLLDALGRIPGKHVCQ
jgi:hypothetical protein